MQTLLQPPRLIALAATTLAAILLLLPAEVLPVPGTATALAVFAIGLWATGVLPEYLSALMFFTLAMLLKAAPAHVVFSGFQSTALWLIFGGLVIGVAIQRTGLGERIASRLAVRLGRSYAGLVAGMVTVGIALSFLMPSSMGRVVLIIPIALAICDRVGFAEGSNGRSGVVFAAVLGCHVPAFAILPANVPNMVMAGAAEKLYGWVPVYGEYLWLHFPVLGLVKSLVMVVLILWLFPARLDHAPEAPKPVPVSRDERRLAGILALALAFWVTDVVHGISPAWIGLAAAVICLIPAVGLVPTKAFNQQLNFGSLFYVAGIMGLGAMVDSSGLGKTLAGAIQALLPLEPGATAVNFFSLSVMGILIGPFVTLPGQPAVLTPLAGDLAAATGLPLEAVLMLQVLAFSTILLPYQSAPMIVGIQLGGQPLGAATRLMALLAVVTMVVLLPLDYLWWRLIGWL